MKTIGVISNVGWTVYNFRRGVIKYFVEKGFKVLVFTKFDKYIPQLEALGCTCIELKRMDLKGKNPYNDLLLLWEFISVFKKSRIDLVFFYTPKVSIYASIAAQIMRIKHIPTINGLGTIFNPNQSPFIQKIVTNLYRFALRKAHLIFFQNNDDRDFFLEKKVISNKAKTSLVKGSGVNLVDFYQKKYEDKANLIFAIAVRLLKEKGIYEFIEAASILKSEFPAAEFVIIGATTFFPGNIDQQIITDAEQNGFIKFWGGTDEMSKTLDKVDVLVLPSYYREGIPRILLEGLSKGLPIITTQNVGCKEVVDENKNGYLVEIKNGKMLADAMRKMLSMSFEQRTKMGNYSRQKAELECDENYIFLEYEKYI